MIKTLIPSRIFRAYDIRGIYGDEINALNANLIGRVLGSMALEANNDSLLVGSDARISSPVLKQAVIEGILDSGCHVVDIGIIPTPLMYFATHSTDYASGVMITASHNPANYNGIKIVLNRTCLEPSAILSIYDRVIAKDYSSGKGTLSRLKIEQQYLDRVINDVALSKPVKVVIDCGNAVAGKIAPILFEKLGCEVIPLYCEPDGNFPNHHPDPTVAKNLQAMIEKVEQCIADVGIAFDGDGDRLGVVTNLGTIIDADRLLMLFVQDIVPRYDKPTIVFDVKCSNTLVDVINESGGIPVMSRSGHTFMKAKMAATGAILGGEFSAHLFLKDRWYGFDDGLYVAARLLELLTRSDKTMEQLADALPKSSSTPELTIDVDEEKKFKIIEQLSCNMDFEDGKISTLDGIRVDFADGWGLIRASNTTPALLLRFEAKDQIALERIQKLFQKELLKVDLWLNCQSL